MTSCRSWDPQHNPPSTIHSCNIINTQQIIATDLELPFMRSFLFGALASLAIGQLASSWTDLIPFKPKFSNPNRQKYGPMKRLQRSHRHNAQRDNFHIISYILYKKSILNIIFLPPERDHHQHGWSNFPASSQQGVRGYVALCDGLACLESWSCEWPMEVLKVREMFSHVLSWSKQFYFSIKWCLSGGQ
jgi:hypothetical protein